MLPTALALFVPISFAPKWLVFIGCKGNGQFTFGIAGFELENVKSTIHFLLLISEFELGNFKSNPSAFFLSKLYDLRPSISEDSEVGVLLGQWTRGKGD